MEAGNPTGKKSFATISRRLIGIGLAAALASALAMVFAGIGYRLGLWHFRTGFTIMGWAFWVAAGSAVVSLAGLFLLAQKPPRLVVAAVVGILVGAATAYIPWTYKQTVARLPFIHDITTDMQNPPAFVAVKGLRKEGDHPVEYDGPEVAALQQKAYPDLAPLTVAADKDKVFAAAEAALKSMKLQIVDKNAAEGRIEAVHTSLLFGFKDDVVVRIAADGAGTKVDVRSKSRVGRSDVGQNAKRIREILQRLKANLA
jgi:uncharacterized protein (DUF1499 family)